MKEVLFTITENRPLAPQVYALRLCGDTSAITAPGQFLELQLPGFFLRRPLSVCDWDDAGVTILYKVVGKGTDWLSQCRPGQTLGALTGLGNGFDVAACGETTLLIGGGIGVPPMYGLARRRQGRHPSPSSASTPRRSGFMKKNSSPLACGLSSRRRTAAMACAAL